MSVTDLITGWSAMEEALPGYELAEAYYEGRVTEVFASDRIRAKLEKTSGKYRFNLAKTPVQVLTTKVELKAVTAKDKAVTDLIQQISDANNLEVEFPDLIRLALEYGDAYLMAWPIDPEDTPDDVQPDPELESAAVEFVVHNPKHCRMMYDPANRRRKWFFIKRWCVDRPAGKKVWRADLWYADRVEHWVSKSLENLTREDGWEPFEGFADLPDTAVEPVEDNDGEEIPFFHFRTALPYGTPVHRDAYGAQNAITKILSTELETVDTVGFPARFALTEAGAELDQAQDDPDFPNGDDAQATIRSGNVTPSALRAGPGTLSWLHGAKGLVQFEGADPAHLLDPAEFYIRLMAQQTWTPMQFFDPAGEVPSGESLKVKNAPLDEHAQRLCTMFTSPVQEAWRLALHLVGKKASATLEVRWKPVRVASDKADWETIGLKQGAGVPQGQTLVEAGYEQDTVDGWLDEDAEAMDLMRRADLMVKVADASQKLGAAVGSGVMNAEQAQQVIAMLMGVKEEPVDGPPVQQDANPSADPAAGGGPTKQGGAGGDQG